MLCSLNPDCLICVVENDASHMSNCDSGKVPTQTYPYYVNHTKTMENIFVSIEANSEINTHTMTHAFNDDDPLIIANQRMCHSFRVYQL